MNDQIAVFYKTAEGLPESLQVRKFLYVIRINFNELKLNEIVRDNWINKRIKNKNDL